MSREKTSPDQIGEGCSASSPRWDLHTAGAGELGTAKIPVCDAASVRNCPDSEATHKPLWIGCQPWFYLRLKAYSFVGLSEGAYGGP
jgi:hypothetical protein